MKHFLGCYRPSQNATEIFTPHNSNIVFEHLKMKIIFLLKLSVALLGGVLQEDLGMDLSSCCGITTMFPCTILRGIGVGNHSLHPVLVLVKLSADRVCTEYKFCFQNQFFFPSQSWNG